MSKEAFKFRDDVWDRLSSKYNLGNSFRTPLQDIGDQYLNLLEAEQARPNPSEIKKRLLAVEEAARRLAYALGQLKAYDIAALTEPPSAEGDITGMHVDKMRRHRNMELFSQTCNAVLSLPTWCQSASEGLPKDKPGAHSKADLLRLLVLGFIFAYEAELRIPFTKSIGERGLLGDYVEAVDRNITQSSLNGALLHVCEVDNSFPKLMRN